MEIEEYYELIEDRIEDLYEADVIEGRFANASE